MEGNQNPDKVPKQLFTKEGCEIIMTHEEFVEMNLIVVSKYTSKHYDNFIDIAMMVLSEIYMFGEYATEVIDKYHGLCLLCDPKYVPKEGEINV